MTRFTAPDHTYHSSFSAARWVFLTSCAVLLGVALFADFLWASSSYSSSAYSLISSKLVLDKAATFVVPDATANEANVKGVVKELKERSPERLLSGTFADIDAPELPWEPMPPAPVPRLDGASAQIKNLFYVFAGYGTIDYVHSHVDIFNFTDNTWVGRLDIPKEMGHSHLGVITDGRYIYVVSGQYGPQCRGPTARTFVLDSETKKWSSLPPLPSPRYAPATQLWRGRLHVMGGSKENRHTPGTEHWSLGVKDGKALEKEWRKEVPLPRGGPHRFLEYLNHFKIFLSEKLEFCELVLVFSNHENQSSDRACVVFNDRLFLIGGQEGDFMPKPGSPIFKCSRRHEVVYGDVYMLDDEMKWKVLPPMPKPDSHIENSWVLVNNSIIITGGTTEKNPVTKRMILVGEVFQFRLDTMTWSVIGRLPYRIKTTLTGFWNGYLYFTSGQRDRGPDNPQPRQVVNHMFRAKLHL